MTRIIAADLRTGQRWNDVPFLDFSYSSRVGTADSLSVTVTLSDPDVAELDLRSSAARGKSIIGIIENDVFLAAGPVWAQSWDEDTNKLTVTAAGWETYFAHRAVLLSLAADQDTYPIILDHDISPDVLAGASNPALDMTFTGFDLGTIGSKMCQAMLAWPGSPSVFLFPDDIPGGRTRTYPASALKNGSDALSELSQVENGPDIFFETRWRPDRLGIEVLYRAGTESEPRLFSPEVHRLDHSVEQSAISGLKVDSSGESLGSQSWVSGGRNVNQAIVRRGFDPTLLTEGFALFDIVDSTHTDASDISTLDGYAAEAVRKGSSPTEFWTFDLRTDTPPLPGEYSKGDFVDILMPSAKPGQSKPYVPGSSTPYRRRIAGIASKNAQNDSVTITAYEVNS